MKKTFIGFFIAFCYLQIGSAQSVHTLQVEVQNIKTQKGTIRACLVADESNFLGDCKYGKDVLFADSQAVILFDGLTAGNYCVMLYHDKNDDKRLNLDGLFGMPSEPYGFSNNPFLLFGPPDFEDCLFSLKADRLIQVKLK